MYDDFSGISKPKLIGVILIVILILLPAYLILKPEEGSESHEAWPLGLTRDSDGNTRIDGDENTSGDTTIYDGKVKAISPESLFTGQVNTLTLDSIGPVVLAVPAQAMIAIPAGGSYRIQNVSFLALDEDATFHLLLAPTSTNFSLVFYGHGSFNFTMMLTSGVEQLISGGDIYELMEDVTDDVGGYNARYVSEGSPQLERGALYFESLFESYGLDAEVQRYWNGNILIMNVIAIKWGLDRNTFVGVGGHMDVSTSTHQGANDDTSGTVHTIMLAKAMASLETQYTYFFGLWSAEEEGIWGSREFLNNFEDNYPGATIKYYFNLDMPGINYPGVDLSTGEYYPLHGYVGGKRNGGVESAPELEAIVNWTAHSFLGYPNITALKLGYNSFGSSDHVSFQRAGIPSVFFIGIIYDYDELHTRQDTLATMRSYMGGQEGLEAGFEVTAWMTLGSLLVIDSE